jgi:hypothetical protein
MKGNFMLTKIKTVLKKVTVVEWVVLGIAVLALWLAVAPKHGGAHKGPHGGDKQSEKAVEVK